MSRLVLVLAASAALVLAACAGGGTTTTASVGSPDPAAPASAPAASGGAGAGACAPSTDAGIVEAAMSGNAFTPATITAKVGDVIAWTNNDDVPHTATLRDDPTCTTENLGNGETGALTFSAAGTYEYFCTIHTDMSGTVEVTS